MTTHATAQGPEALTIPVDPLDSRNMFLEPFSPPLMSAHHIQKPFHLAVIYFFQRLVHDSSTFYTSSILIP